MTVPRHLAGPLAAWREGRRYDVPPEMVAKATERRAAGDVVGACAAARTDLLADVDRVHRSHGAEVADRLAGDLRHLAPDLIRWHAPRQPVDGKGPIRSGRVITLAVYGPERDGTVDALYVRTPSQPRARQRLEIHFGRVDVRNTNVQIERWNLSRHLWDDRRTGDLFRRSGGMDRLPFHAPDGRLLGPDELPAGAPVDDPVALFEWVTLLQDANREPEAWAAAGVPLNVARGRRFRRGGIQGLVAPTALRDAADRHLGAAVPGTEVVLSPDGDYSMDGWLAILRIADTQLSARVAVAKDDDPRSVWGRSATAEQAADLRRRREARRRHYLPWTAWHRAPDLDLLRLGLLTPEELHPLVRDALFPAAGKDYRPRHPGVPETVRVRCGSQWHRIGWRDGRLDPHDHPPAEILRERALRALGAKSPACFTALAAWTGGPARRLRRGRADLMATPIDPLPRALRDLRRHAVSLLFHGDAAGFLRVLDSGVAPAGLRDRFGNGPLHLLAHLNPADAPRVVERLMAAGLDPGALSFHGWPPLVSVLTGGASEALVRALLDAGAGALLTDELHTIVVQLLIARDSEAVLAGDRSWTPGWWHAGVTALRG